jgi:hypothetical protein
MMSLYGVTELKIAVNNEEDLYTPLSPDNEFTIGVKTYLSSKVALAEFKNNICLTVISSVPIDEERFRSAVASWIHDEKIVFKQQSKISTRMLIGMLLVASLFITVSLSLVEHVNVFSYTIIPVLGSVALGKAAGICITEIPINNAKLKLINELEKNNTIIFKYKESE